MNNVKPNIIYIHCHDAGRYISPHGYGLKSPNLHRLAKQGVLFRNNFCVAPGSSASRASLLTGTYPHQNGMLGLIHRGFSLRNYKMHLLHSLHKLGYESALAGVQYIAMAKGEKAAWERIGYSKCISDIEDAHIEAKKYLKEQSKKERPFFLSLGFLENLREFPRINKKVCDPRYCLPPAVVPDNNITRNDMAAYATSLFQFDTKLGYVLDAVEEYGLSENTLIICTTTNGLSLPNMKCSLYDEGVGSFLIAKGPQGFSGGKVIDAMTSHLDIFPTLCELLGMEEPHKLEGKSLLSLVNGQVSKLHQELYFQINYHASAEPTRAIRTERFKYIKRFSVENNIPAANCDDSITKTLFIDSGWHTTKPDNEALYDLLLDPMEKNNLIGLEPFNNVYHELKTKLQDWMLNKRDPLIFGYLNPPRGTKVNPVYHISPMELPLEEA